MNKYSNSNYNDFLKQYIVSPIEVITDNINNGLERINNSAVDLFEATGDLIQDVSEATKDIITKPVNLLSEALNGITTNWVYIILLVVAMFVWLVISVLSVDNNDTKKEVKKEETKIIITEGMTNKEKKDLMNNISGNGGFCSKYSGKSDLLDEQCKKLTKDNCNLVDCCVYLEKNGKGICVAGDKTGPTFNNDNNGNLIQYDYYYYRNKCIGSKCEKK